MRGIQVVDSDLLSVSKGGFETGDRVVEGLVVDWVAKLVYNPRHPLPTNSVGGLPLYVCEDPQVSQHACGGVGGGGLVVRRLT